MQSIGESDPPWIERLRSGYIYAYQNDNAGNLQTILEVVSIIDFAPLWETMKQKQVSQYQILKRGIDNKTLDSLKKNKNITLTTLEKLCKILECTPNEIVRFHD